MNRQKQRNISVGEEHLEMLVAFDYKVQQFSEYHFRINDHLDVWPITRKWYDRKSQRKGVYNNLYTFVRGGEYNK